MNSMIAADTIAAIATPVAVGGIGMVRISGPQAFAVADSVFVSVSGRKVSQTEGYRGLFGRLHDDQGEIDEAVVFVYRNPKSYTGEDVVEICCHGGIYLVQRTLRACISAGARPAQAGEFTRRAFLNGKMNLTQAEAVVDLIASQGRQSAQAALSARDGAVFQKIHKVVDKMLEVSSALAAWVDYPDEDIEEVSDDNLRRSVDQICDSLHTILREYDSGRVLREGVRTVIVGRPNVGKSTLMNLLSGEQKSIVTQIPGTTRDVVEDTIRLGDVVLHLADTAGLRDTDDPVERMGVELARKRLDSSDLVLAVFDSSEELSQQDLELIDQIKDRPVVAVINKTDLERKMDIEQIKEKIPHIAQLSASAGEGVEELETQVREILNLAQLDSSSGIIANERQRACVEEATKTMEQAQQALQMGETLDAVNVCIDAAIDDLLELTGERASEAVIDQVFARFCVGK